MQYLSPKQLGRAIGVSESSLKRWIDAGRLGVVRTSGGHRRVALPEAVRFVREQGYAVQDPTALGLAASDERLGRASEDQVNTRLLELLQDGKDAAFRDAVARLYLDGWSLHAIVDGPIRRAMQSIGELWHFKPDGVGIEHRATDICTRTVGYLHALVPPASADAPLALGGSPPGDQHLLASLCVSLVLAECGWREANLGANTPWDQFVSAARREQASLAWLSLTAEPSADWADAIGDLARRLAELDCRLIVGGRQAGELLKRLRHPNLHAAGSMAELVAFSRGLQAAQRPLNGGRGA